MTSTVCESAKGSGAQGLHYLFLFANTKKKQTLYTKLLIRISSMNMFSSDFVPNHACLIKYNDATLSKQAALTKIKGEKKQKQTDSRKSAKKPRE